MRTRFEAGPGGLLSSQVSPEHREQRNGLIVIQPITSLKGQRETAYCKQKQQGHNHRSSLQCREKHCTHTIHTCSWAVGAFLLCVLAGLFHPRENLFGYDWGGSTGASGAGRFLFLCGVAVRAG